MTSSTLDAPEAAAARRAARIAAWASAALTGAFLVTLMVTPLLGPLPTEWRGAAAAAESFVPATMIALIPSLLLVPVVLVLLAAMHTLAGPEQRLWTTVALLFGAVYGALVAANDYLALMTVRTSLEARQPEGLDPFVWTNPNGIFGALETLGYLAQAAALAALVPMLRPGRHGRPIARLLGANLALGLLTVVALAAGAFALIFPGLVVWSLIFGPAMVLVARAMRV